MPQTCWRYWKNRTFSLLRTLWCIWQTPHEMARQDYWQPSLSRLGSEDALLEWRHQNSGRVRVYNFGSCCIKVVIEEPRLSSNCLQHNRGKHYRSFQHRSSPHLQQIRGWQTISLYLHYLRHRHHDNNGNVAQVSRMANSWFHLHCNRGADFCERLWNI